jgi:predicted dehydrogenase
VSSHRLQIGLIGVGGIAEVAHLPGYERGGADIYALCTRHPEHIDHISRQYSVKQVVSDYRELLKFKEVEAVSVCVPTYLHAEITKAALRAGKHVLCEKPPALNAQDAAEMLEVARETGKLLMYGFSARFKATSQKLKAFVDKGILGEIYGAKAGWMRRRGNPAGWFTEKEKAGGGALIDLGVHGLDLAWWIMGRPKPISASGMIYRKFGNYASDDAATPDPVMQRHLKQQAKRAFEVEDSAFAMLRFVNGSHLMLEASWALNCAGERRYTTFYGTKGGAEMESDIKIFTDLDGTLVDIEPQVSDGNAYYAQMRHFVAAVRGDEEPITTAEDGVAIMKMIDAVYRSADLGQEISIH